MYKDTIHKQEGGDNSTNLQGEAIIINQGINYKDVKDIALDVFKENFLKLSEISAKIALDRAEEIIDSFLIKFLKNSVQSSICMADPGMQYAIFTAQREYARTGDKDIAEILTDILVARASVPHRSLKQIILDESLSVIPKLTVDQLDTISLILSIRNLKDSRVVDMNTFDEFISTYVKPFTYSVLKDSFLIQHLEYTGCVSIGQKPSTMESLFLYNYEEVFGRKFTDEEFLDAVGRDVNSYASFVENHSKNPTLYRFIPERSFYFDPNNPDGGENKIHMSVLNKVKSYLPIDVANLRYSTVSKIDYLCWLDEIWTTSSLQYVKLTSVGIALAISNLRRKTGMELDMGIWIK